MAKIVTASHGTLAFLPIEAVVPCTEILEWKTSAKIMHDGSESRTRLRSEPRQSVRYRYPEGVVPKLEAFLTQHNALGLEWAVPIWFETAEPGAIPSGTNTINVPNADKYSYYIGSLALIYESPTKYEILEVDGLNPTQVSFSTNVANSYTNPRVTPVRVGIINRQLQAQSKGHIAVADITYQIKDNLAVTPLDTGVVYRGEDIYYDEPLMENATVGYRRTDFTQTDLIDYELGAFDKRTPWINNRIRRPSRAIQQGPVDIRYFKEFLERRGGKYKAYWEPSFEADLILAEKPEFNVGDNILVKDIGLEDWDHQRKFIAIQDICGGWYARNITGYAQEGDNIRLTILPELEIFGTAIASISWLGLKRLDTDRVQIQWSGNNVMSSNINTVEIST